MRRNTVLAVALALGLAAAGPSFAQISISHSPSGSPAVGRVVSGNAATTFSVSSAGVVSRSSGNAVRVNSASITPPTITITCGTNSNCITRDVRVTVTATGASDDASISLFRIGSLTGATYRTSAPANGTSLTFDLRPLGSGRSASFPLGMDVLLNASADSAPDTFTYTVTATFR